MQMAVQNAAPAPATPFEAEVERLRATGALGRSAQLQRLFDFLVQCHAEGRTPKEIEVAIGAFGREPGFDAGQDALVRVHAHKLRRRLEEHYRDEAGNVACRLYLPRGEYRLAVAGEGEAAGTAPAVSASVPQGALPAVAANEEPPPRDGSVRWVWALCAALALCTAWLLWREWERPRDPEVSAARASGLWKPLLSDNVPIQIVLGDYYIFGERDSSNGIIQRLVRDFAINSRQDLETQMMADPKLAERYADLHLGYLPTSSAQALREVLPVLTSSGKRVSVTLASELDPSTIKSMHIVYIGYLSALGMLRDVVFAGSRYSFGGSYDEMLDSVTGRLYTSEGGMPRGDGQRYRDYAYLSTFAGPTGIQHMVIGGARDVGLMQAAENAADPARLAVLAGGVKGARDYEALYEVSGVNGVNIDSRLLMTSKLEPLPPYLDDPD
ncbi:MAG: hypothetical protein QM696_14595 [Steroidobacteraceae bacterium]